jgi:hypothetical protein
MGALLATCLSLVPSVALYGFLAWSVARYVQRRQVLYLVAALAPFAWWASAMVAGNRAKAEAQREHANVVRLPAPAELPDTIVFEGEAGFPKPAEIRKHFGFRYAIYVRSVGKRGEPRPTRRLRYDLRDPHASKPELVAGAPERCVVFRAKEASAYWHDGRVKAADGGPFELHYVDGARDNLIGFYYRGYVPVPMFPPILSLDGWSSASNSIGTQALRGLMLEFMSNALGRT